LEQNETVTRLRAIETDDTLNAHAAERALRAIVGAVFVAEYGELVMRESAVAFG
jgi:hypothetical protein